MELPGEDWGGDPSPRPGMRERERGKYCRVVLKRFCRKDLDINHLLYFYFFNAVTTTITTANAAVAATTFYIVNFN